MANPLICLHGSVVRARFLTTAEREAPLGNPDIPTVDLFENRMVEPTQVEQLVYRGQSENCNIKDKNNQAYTGSAAAGDIFTGFTHSRNPSPVAGKNTGRQNC